ncbi:MAG: zf-HC2 domain-containing protein [Pseudomonadota bacterium]
MTSEHDLDELLSGYLDGELTQQQRQRVDVHLAQSEEYRERLARLKEVRSRLGDARLSSKDNDYWRENMNDPVTKVTEGIGWLLFVGALLILSGMGIYAFVIESDMGLLEKLLVSAIYLGLGILFFSVLRQRLIERKTDKYKDVEI